MADPEGGCGGCNPPLIFEKNTGHPRDRCDIFSWYFIKQCCLCALNALVIVYYSTAVKIGTAIVHYYFVLPGGAAWRLTNKLCSTFGQNSVCPPNGC